MDNDNHRAPMISRAAVRELRAWKAQQAPPSCRANVLARVGLCDAYGSIDTPLGLVFVAYNDVGISAVMLSDDAAEFEERFRARFGRKVCNAETLPPALARSVREQVSGGHGDLHFDLRGLTEFERAVLFKALEIPRGEVRPYSWIAREIGRPKAVRAVGSALAANPVPLLIPCHRVVRSDGHIGNYALGNDRKRVVLQAEGAAPDRIEMLARAHVRFFGNPSGSFCLPTCGGEHLIDDPERVPLRSEHEALAAGYRPCRDCRPIGLV